MNTRFVLNPEDGDQVIDQYGVLWVYDSEPKSWINLGFLDIYGSVNRESDGLVYPDLFHNLEALDPDKFNCLKLLSNSGAGFYYLYSSDDTVEFKLEEQLGESQLRVEASHSTLSRKFREFWCNGPKGAVGDKGEKGASGIPAQREPTNSLDISANGLVQIESSVNTPIDTPVSLRLIRNQQQIGEMLVYVDGEVSISFIDDYGIKDGTTYDIYILDNVLYATFEIDGDLTGIWSYKLRQTGPRGNNGNDGSWFLAIEEELIPDELISNDVIFEVDKSGNDIAYNRQSADNVICATGINPIPFMKFKLDTTPLVSAKYVFSSCKDIVIWSYTKPAVTVPEIELPQWTPTECCPKTRISSDGTLNPENPTAV